MIRTIFVWSCIVIATLALGALVFITYPFYRRGKGVHPIPRLWGKTVLQANGVRVEVQGMENLKGEGPYIFMSNHQGSFDIFALLGYLPYPFKWLAKKELFSIPLFGWILAAVGYIRIDREGSRDTVRAMREAAEKIQDGISVVIFPEGSRSPNGSIQSFKKGGFTLAIKSKVPIVPVAISGSREIMPKDQWRVCPGEIQIRMGQPIATQNYSLKDREILMEKVREAIIENFKLISQPQREVRS